jgi:hypothetical protein
VLGLRAGYVPPLSSSKPEGRGLGVDGVGEGGVAVLCRFVCVHVPEHLSQ